MVVSAGNFDDEAEIRFDHELTGLSFASANSAADLFFICLIEEGGLPDALEVSLEGGGQFRGAKG